MVWLWTLHRIDTASRPGARPGLRSNREIGGTDAPDREPRDRGDVLQTVIITAALAAAAIVIVAIIVAKARNAANRIKTQ